MKVNQAQIDALTPIVGAERAKEMAGNAEKLGGDAEAAGVHSKAVAIDVEDKQARGDIDQLKTLAQQTFEAVTKMSETVTTGEATRTKALEDLTTTQKDQGERLGKIEEFLSMSSRGSKSQEAIVNAQSKARDASLMAAIEQGGGQQPTGEKGFFDMFAELLQQRNGQPQQPQVAGE